jgi:hypothetical protein
MCRGDCHCGGRSDFSTCIVQEEEEQAHSRVSKAAQKRARKKAAAAAASAAAEDGQQQRPVWSADTQDRSNPSVSAATAELQQLHHDAPAAAAAGSATAAPSRCQPMHGWMLCPLSKVGSRLCCHRGRSLCAIFSRGQMSCRVRAGGLGRPRAVQRWPHIQPCRHHSVARNRPGNLTDDRTAPCQPRAHPKPYAAQHDPGEAAGLEQLIRAANARLNQLRQIGVTSSNLAYQ